MTAGSRHIGRVLPSAHYYITHNPPHGGGYIMGYQVIIRVIYDAATNVAIFTPVGAKAATGAADEVVVPMSRKAWVALSYDDQCAVDAIASYLATMRVPCVGDAVPTGNAISTGNAMPTGYAHHEQSAQETWLDDAKLCYRGDAKPFYLQASNGRRVITWLLGLDGELEEVPSAACTEVPHVLVMQHIPHHTYNSYGYMLASIENHDVGVVLYEDDYIRIVDCATEHDYRYLVCLHVLAAEHDVDAQGHEEEMPTLADVLVSQYPHLTDEDVQEFVRDIEETNNSNRLEKEEAIRIAAENEKARIARIEQAESKARTEIETRFKGLSMPKHVIDAAVEELRRSIVQMEESIEQKSVETRRMIAKNIAISEQEREKERAKKQKAINSKVESDKARLFDSPRVSNIDVVDNSRSIDDLSNMLSSITSINVARCKEVLSESIKHLPKDGEVMMWIGGKWVAPTSRFLLDQQIVIIADVHSGKYDDLYYDVTEQDTNRTGIILLEISEWLMDSGGKRLRKSNSKLNHAAIIQRYNTLANNGVYTVCEKDCPLVGYAAIRQHFAMRSSARIIRELFA